MDDTVHKIVYDTNLKRPACALLQAVYGGSTEALNMFFDARDWLVFPTKGMGLMEGNRELWNKVSEITKNNMKRKINE